MLIHISAISLDSLMEQLLCACYQILNDPPAVVGGSFWKAWMALSRWLRGMLPEMVRNPKPCS